jgi:hypothetical protein
MDPMELGGLCLSEGDPLGGAKVDLILWSRLGYFIIDHLPVDLKAGKFTHGEDLQDYIVDMNL